MPKTVKPQTNLLLDIGLFSLVSLHLTAACAVSIVLHDTTASAYEMWHRVLGFTGVMLALAVTTHLTFHLPWIKLQFKRFAQR